MALSALTLACSVPAAARCRDYRKEEGGVTGEEAEEGGVTARLLPPDEDGDSNL